MIKFIKEVEKEFDYLSINLTKEDREDLTNYSINELVEILSSDSINTDYYCLLESIVLRVEQEKTPELKNFRIEQKDIEKLSFKELEEILLDYYNEDIEGYDIEDARYLLDDYLIKDANKAECYIRPIIESFIPIKHYSSLTSIRTFINNELDQLNKSGYISDYYVSNVDYKVIIK